MNQVEFAKRIGVGTSTVSRWVNGRIPEAKLIDSIADVLVLDYDFVATKAGYRPDIADIPQDSREAAVLGMVHRIDWKSDVDGIGMVVDMLEVLAKRVPKRHGVIGWEEPCRH